jgi:four helix bundle protein
VATLRALWPDLAGSPCRPEFRRFLDYSLGSLSELAYLLRFAHDVQFLTDDAWAKLQQMRDKAAILTWRLSRSLSTPK